MLIMGNPDQDPSRLSLKRKFARGFLRALARIHRRQSQGVRSRRRVKAAADVAMASAVGPTRVWSRAVLRRRHGRLIRTTRHGHGKGRTEKKLREVVPGGEDMDVQRLLEETFHYISCLKTQVNVMRCIADIYST